MEEGGGGFHSPLSFSVSSFFTHHLPLIYIIPSLILQLSAALHLRVHFLPLFLVYSPSAASRHPFTFPLISIFPPSSHLFESSHLLKTSENTENLLSVYSFPLSLLTSLSSAPTLPQRRQLHAHVCPRTHIHGASALRHGTWSWQGYINKVKGSLPLIIKNPCIPPSLSSREYVYSIWKHMRGIHLQSRRVRCYQHGHLHTQRYKAASLYLNKTYTLSLHSARTQRDLFLNGATFIWHYFGRPHARTCTHSVKMAADQPGGSSLRALSQSCPGWALQALAGSGNGVKCVLPWPQSCCYPAADINDWHISHIFPSLNSLQERNGVWRKRERNICTLRFQDNRSYVLSTWSVLNFSSIPGFIRG